VVFWRNSLIETLLKIWVLCVFVLFFAPFIPHLNKWQLNQIRNSRVLLWASSIGEDFYRGEARRLNDGFCRSTL